jgi:hypothetical protein
MRRRVILATISTLLLAAALISLRDPRWLLQSTSGLRQWEVAADGTRFRWTGGHASFFVSSAARTIEIPLRATFDRPGDLPIVVTITMDDRPVDRIVLSDAAWRRSFVRLPPRGSRRTRRIDIRVDRTRDDNHGVQLGVLASDGGD